MKYKKLGRSNLYVSEIGFGCWAISGSKWGPTDDNESMKALKKTVELGINFFDTADFYGFGHSEELLGKSLAKTNDVIIATKAGLKWSSKGQISHDLSEKYILQACDASLKRLNRETIDLYQIHWPDPKVPISETINALSKLIQAGKIRFAGVCNFDKILLEDIKHYPWIVSDQEIFNLFKQDARFENIPFCKEHNLGFIGYEPLFKGMLTGKYKEKPDFPKGDHRKHKERFNDLFNFFKPKIDYLCALAESRNLKTSQLALGMLLHNEDVTTVIPGAKTEEQVSENAGAAYIDRELLDELSIQISEVF